MALSKKYIDAIRSLLDRRERPSLSPAAQRTALSEALGVGSGEATDTVIDYPVYSRFAFLPMNNTTDTAGIPPDGDPVLLSSKGSRFLPSVGTEHVAPVAAPNNWWSTDGSIVLHWQTAGPSYYQTLVSTEYSNAAASPYIYSNTYPGAYLAEAPSNVVGACVFHDAATATRKLLVACRSTSSSIIFYYRDWEPTTQTYAFGWTFLTQTSWASGRSDIPVRFSGSGAQAIALNSMIENNYYSMSEWTFSWNGSSILASNSQSGSGILEPLAIDFSWTITSQQTTTTWSDPFNVTVTNYYSDSICSVSGTYDDHEDLQPVLDSLAGPGSGGETRYHYESSPNPDASPDTYELQEYDEDSESWFSLATLYLFHFTERDLVKTSFGSGSYYHPLPNQWLTEYPNTNHALTVTTPMRERLVAVDYVGDEKVEVWLRAEIVRDTGTSVSLHTEGNRAGVRTPVMTACWDTMGVPENYQTTWGGVTGSLDIDFEYRVSLVKTGALSGSIPVYAFALDAAVSRSSGTPWTHTEATTATETYRKLLHYDARTDVVVWQEGVDETVTSGTGDSAHDSVSNFALFETTAGTALQTVQTYKDQSIRMTTTGHLGTDDEDVVVVEASFDDDETTGSTQWGRALGADSIASNEYGFDYSELFASGAYLGKSAPGGDCLVSAVNLYVPKASESKWVDVLLTGNGNSSIDVLPIVEGLLPGGTAWTWERSGHPNLGEIILMHAGTDAA